MPIQRKLVPMKFARMRNQRKGITLLFVVSLIVLFLLMGTAFTAVSSQFLRTSRAKTLFRARGDSGRALVDRAFFDVLRGPALTDTTSPLRGLDILSDQYGYGFKGDVGTATLASGEILQVTLSPGTLANFHPNGPLDPLTLALSDVLGAYDGLIFSFVDGAAKGTSCRIVRYIPANMNVGGGALFYVALEWSDGVDPFATPANLVGSEVVINGRPFSGKGAGEITTPLAVTQTGTNALIAQNPTGTLFTTYCPNASSPAESYDAIDHQNLHLAGVDVENNVVYPSFFRPSVATGFRPTLFPALANLDSNGNPPPDELDVDTDGDGIKDAIWIDIGLPVQTDMETGRRYRPLVAYQILDMDGRFNLNAHGNEFDVNGRNATSSVPLALGAPAVTDMGRGQGYGPGEVSLAPLLGNAPASDYANVLFGSAWEGRYGNDGGQYKPGQVGVDPWAVYKFFDYPATTTGVGGSYGSLLDIHGRFGIGTPAVIDGFGIPFSMPVADVTASGLPDEFSDSVYEGMFARYPFGLHGSIDDQRFTPLDLERILRPFDADNKMLPSRLSDLLLATMNTSIANRHALTTESWEVPVPPQHLAETFHEILTSSGMTDVVANGQLQIMLSNDLLSGAKFDINRPLGDGQDNNVNGVVDEAEEGTGIQSVVHPSGVVNLDLNNDGNPSNDTDVRQIYARQLYVLILLTTELVERDGVPGTTLADWYDYNNDTMVDVQDRLDYRRDVAQWVANVVDFRDRDSIMFGFEYDTNPYNGWNVDGILTNTGEMDRDVVFGTEAPALLITETLAMHDRRTEDLNDDGSTTSDMPPDGFDSKLVPIASCFFELYNPWVTGNLGSGTPAELTTTNTGVDLQRVTPTGSSPVWRMIVARVDDADDPDSPLADTDITRKIYFTTPGPTVEAAPDNRVYFVDSAITPLSSEVAPGQFAVVGSAGIQSGDEYTTYLGRNITNDLTSTRRITLNPVTNQVTVTQYDGNMPAGQTPSVRSNVVALPIGKNGGTTAPGGNRSLGISDPIDGYYSLSPISAVFDGEQFDNTRSMPADEELANNWGLLQSDELKQKFQVVHLQRLANPLQPFDAVTNPYLTIDAMAVDLLPFNGAADDSADSTQTTAQANVLPASFERGTNDDVGPESNRRKLWAQDVAGRSPTTPTAPLNLANDEHFHPFDLVETLGNVDANYRNFTDPIAFPWLTWNNRPFVSHLELANVPVSRSSQLLADFTLARSLANVQYEAPAMRSSGGTNQRRFGHLVNFFAATSPNPMIGNQADFCRFMEYVEVPSRFLGTERYVGTVTPGNVNNHLYLHPPFNYIRRFRVPGKVNINTILDRRIWTGVMGTANDPFGTAGLAVSYDDMDDARRANTTPMSDPTGEFLNPFRSADAANFVVGSGPKTSSEVGLFRRTFTGTSTTDQPLFDYLSTAFHDRSDRSAYFRNQVRQRMGNLLTTRSSVYAIWVTVGFFEVDSSNTVLPVELGSDNGKVKRHRGFYMVDRSIPVAFEPGKNHNTERAILLRTIID